MLPRSGTGGLPGVFVSEGKFVFSSVHHHDPFVTRALAAGETLARRGLVSVDGHAALANAWLGLVTAELRLSPPYNASAQENSFCDFVLSIGGDIPHPITVVAGSGVLHLDGAEVSETLAMYDLAVGGRITRVGALNPETVSPLFMCSQGTGGCPSALAHKRGAKGAAFAMTIGLLNHAGEIGATRRVRTPQVPVP